MAKVISQLPSGGSVPKHNNLLGLNEGDYLHLTQFEKAKLDGIQSGAEVNVNTDWNAISGDAQILNKPTSFPPSTHTHTISEITDFPTFKTIEGQSIIGAGNIDLDKNSVGLGNVDNTSDLNKIISTATQTALNALQLNKEDKANKNIANGYAGLDSSGKIIPTQLPALAITDTFVVASQAEQLALVAEVGDVAVRTDLNKSFILRVTGASTLANWQELLSPTSVDQTIIDGSTNSVSGNAVFDALALKSNIGHTHVASQITDLSKASVGLGNVDNTSDLSKPLSTATINALATKFPTPTGLTTNYLPKWNGSGFGNSIASEVGGEFKVNGSGLFTSGIKMNYGSTIDAIGFTNTKILSTGYQSGINDYVAFFTPGSGGGGEVMRYLTNQTLLIGSYLENGSGSKLQVAGTISASPATTANQVVVKSQLDAVAGTSGSYTPTLTPTNAVSVVLKHATYQKIGNIVTVRISVYFTPTSTTLYSGIECTLPFNRATALTNNMGSGVIADITAYKVAIVQSMTTTTTNLLGLTGTLNSVLMSVVFQYSILE